MIFTLMMMALTMALIFLALKHPLSMGFALLIQSMLISLITGLFNYNFWYSYIIFLIMIGGMLVLFIYMTSIASNEKFFFSYKITLMTTVLVVATMMIYLIMDKYLFYTNSLTMMMTAQDSNIDWILSLNKYLNYPTNILMIMLFMYLFITLVAVVKITNVSYGPLRQKF
uniref:NADH-ubiquinone oxidoreductase chain 6 n=1 Tax=Julodinae sp. MJTNT-2012 TaxID=1131601 RepID=H9BJX5_9COLE|nr:NADH dehydrogenase subunit 6 [Julodinae sp. MJTNT-2012]